MAPGGVAGGIQLTVKSLQLTDNRCVGAAALLLLNSFDCQRNQEKSQLFRRARQPCQYEKGLFLRKNCTIYGRILRRLTVGSYDKDADNQYITQKPPNLPTYQPTENRIFFCYLFLNDYMTNYLYRLL